PLGGRVVGRLARSQALPLREQWMFGKFSQFRPLQKEVWRIPAIYFAVSGAWILLSDTLLGALPLPLDELVWFSAAKGMAFVAFTTLLLFLLIRRAYRKQLKLELANQ